MLLINCNFVSRMSQLIEEIGVYDIILILYFISNIIPPPLLQLCLDLLQNLYFKASRDTVITVPCLCDSNYGEFIVCNILE